MEVTGSFDNRGAAAQELRFTIDDLVGNTKHYNSRLTDFNNDSATTFENIQELLRTTENNLTEKMAQTDGTVDMRRRSSHMDNGKWIRDGTVPAGPVGEYAGGEFGAGPFDVDVAGGNDG